MRGKELFDKFTNIKSEYILEVLEETERVANSKGSSHGRKIIRYRKWFPLVACIIGVLIIGPFVIELLPVMNESTSATTTATEEMSGNTTEEGAIEYIEEESTSEFLALYVDVSGLPLYEAAAEYESNLEDRVVVLETSIDNELERAVYEIYCNSMSDEYICTTTIHDMSILSQEEVSELASSLEWNLDVYAQEPYLEQTAIVLVDQTWEETHGAIGGGTYEYIPEGKYEKYFVLGLIDGNWELLMTVI